MFYGLDVHKEFIQVGQISKDGKERRDFRIGASAEAIEAFAARLGRIDAVALEATFHSWAIQRILGMGDGLHLKGVGHHDPAGVALEDPLDRPTVEGCFEGHRIDAAESRGELLDRLR